MITEKALFYKVFSVSDKLFGFMSQIHIIINEKKTQAFFRLRLLFNKKIPKSQPTIS